MLLTIYAKLCDCLSNNDAAAVEAALFDGADRCNDVCRCNKLFTIEVEEESSSSAGCGVGRACRMKNGL